MHQQGLFALIVYDRASCFTAIYDAIGVYLSRVQESPGRKVLVLMTDGEDSTSGLSLAETIQLVHSSPVTLYAIAFPGQYTAGSNRALYARAFLHQLADLTGGDVFTPVASKDLAQVYDRLRVRQSKARPWLSQAEAHIEAKGPQAPPPCGLPATGQPLALLSCTPTPCRSGRGRRAQRNPARPRA